ncbi:hypothetical protein SUGI_0089310 [Cryptomeria japonica]|nr:hypothetical protein SUGI_0089310 [Cryptomeria japonica]
MRIPKLGWPYFYDQDLDRHFCKNVWRIVIDLEGVEVDENENLVVKREEIEKGVRRLMKAKELRKRVMELKDAALKAAGHVEYYQI